MKTLRNETCDCQEIRRFDSLRVKVEEEAFLGAGAQSARVAWFRKVASCPLLVAR
jgi:hypothetical protein